ncbi:centromere protein L [Erpetoichthys calabaricus]|uniref:Centromere protein L n=1 Tax=Erpetoichthys calabaricus TaxID=27687 RepID=A0A8C4X9E2_ERPCA|nr:centromere protein L [Erpetoichthys calabaricus]
MAKRPKRRDVPGDLHSTPNISNPNGYASGNLETGLPSSRKYASFRRFSLHKPPSSREINKANNLSQKIEPEQISLLIGKDWHLHYVTPLYKFSHSAIRSYSRQLSAFIAAEKQKGVPFDMGSDNIFRVNFSIILGIAEKEGDSEAVFIQIYTKQFFAIQGTTENVIWSGWLACVNCNTEYISSLPPRFTYFPLFCSNGPETMTAIVRTWFQKTFDCNFGNLSINYSNLSWLAAIWTDCKQTVDFKYLKLSWTLPLRPPLDVTYTINSEDGWELWNSIHKENDQITLEEMGQFMYVLESHFFRHFKVHLTFGELIEVSTSLGVVQKNGRIKFLSGERMTAILTLLTENAVLMMPV